MPEPVAVATPLTALHPAEWNPRTIRDERFKNLCRSIEADPEFLWRRPVLAMADGTIYAGNMRYRAAQHLGLATVPAIVEDLPEQLARERALRDNAQWGDWHDDQLAEMVRQLGADGSDLELLGIEPEALARMLAVPTEGLTDPDAVPETPAEPITQPGDLWILGAHRVLCGDSTKAEDVARLLDGAVPNLMVTDPPYGVEYDPEWRDKFSPGRISRGQVTGDDRADWRQAWGHFAGPVAYVWHAHLFAHTVRDSLVGSGFSIRAGLIWAKPYPTLGRGHYHWAHECCWYASRGEEVTWCGDRKQTSVWEMVQPKDPYGHSGEDKTPHPTQKPVEAMSRPIRNHTGDVYDPFLGSGTTLIAAEQLGRRCYGMEIEPRYCDVIVKRWEDFTGRKAALQS